MRNSLLIFFSFFILSATISAQSIQEQKLALDAAGASNSIPNAAVAPTANDDCANAEAITAFGQITLDIGENTEELTDPGFSCQIAGSDFTQTTWYTITPATSGLLTISACNTDQDGLLGIYTGSCGSFVEVACGEDECDGPGSGFAPEIVDAAVTGGTTYYICYAEWGVIPTNPHNMILDVSGDFTFDNGGGGNPIPTMSEWGVIILGFLFVIFGIVAVRRRTLVTS